MKSQTLIGLATITISLSACSQQRPTPVHSGSTSKSYYVNNTHKATNNPASQRVVYRPAATRAQHRPAPRRVQPRAQQRPPAERVVRHTPVRRPVQRAPVRKANMAAQVNQKELYSIGDKIFQNESGGRIDQLVHWNKREDFAAMGIGHFTWYPAGRRQRFGNTFPGLLDYLQQNGVKLPHWVQRARFEGAPWRSRSELMAAKNTPQVREFAQLLYNTRHLQAQYIMNRAMRAMPRLVKKTPSHLRSQVANNLNAVANTPGGRYVLIDYVNFKGEGLNRHGGYKGHNWGLLQVLEEMRPARPGQQALNEFADAAMRVLERRVRNSNPARNERKWLAGWRNRTNTYRSPI
ncbi:MAG TPA: hypothetical protein EYH16_00815 [Leucothrix mucor]|nr:hypothetical protein [Leucothrix mucor]